MEPFNSRRVNIGWDNLERTGDFYITAISHTENPPATNAIIFLCPCGCKATTRLPLIIGPQGQGRAIWGWDGNLENPTLTPSIRDLTHCRFHGHLQNGVWSFQPDSGTK